MELGGIENPSLVGEDSFDHFPFEIRWFLNFWQEEDAFVATENSVCLHYFLYRIPDQRLLNLGLRTR